MSQWTHVARIDSIYPQLTGLKDQEVWMKVVAAAMERKPMGSEGLLKLQADPIEVQSQ